MPRGFFLPKPKTAAPPPPPHALKVTFPGELWAAIETAAQANDATPEAVVLHAVRRALRHELASVKRAARTTAKDTPAE